MSGLKRSNESDSGSTPIKRSKILVTDFFKKNNKVERNTQVKTIDNPVKSDNEKQNYAKEIPPGSGDSTDITLSKLTDIILSNVPGPKKHLLELELESIDVSWLEKLKNEFSKPYFLQLKEFVTKEQKNNTVFPPAGDIYSWSRLTKFPDVHVVIIGQDPYHNFNQAHGLAFSVKSPTPAPPSLKNIYKELQMNNYSDFKVNYSYGDLTSWSKQGVLLLNTCLTVRAHSANSHSKKGWEQFTKRAIDLLIEDREKTGRPIVFLLWGSNAIKLVEDKVRRMPKNFLVLKSVHPSPLSASRGFFGNSHFKKINEWLYERKLPMIDWSVVPGSRLEEVVTANSSLP